MGCAGTLQRNAVFKIFNPLGIFIQHPVLRGFKPSWSKAVDRYAIFAPVIGQAHRQLANSATAGSIRRKTSVSSNTCYRSDVNDAAIAMLDHVARNGLGYKKAAAQIGVKHQ